MFLSNSMILLSPGDFWHLKRAHGEVNGVFFAFHDFGELSYQVSVVHLVCEGDISVDGGDVLEDSQSEGGVPGHGEMDDMVRHGSFHVPGDAVGTPVRSLASNVEVYLAVPGSAEVEVGLVHLPVETSVKVPLGSLNLSIEFVLQEESFSLHFVVGEMSLPGDFGLNPVTISHSDLGLEGVISEGVVSTAELLSVDLELSLVAVASPNNFESSETLAIGFNLQVLTWVMVDSHHVLVHVAVDLVQEGGHVERHLVRLLVGCKQGLHDGLFVLLDVDLKLSGSLVEGSEQSVVFDNSSIEGRVGINHNRIAENQLDLIVVDSFLG